MLLTILEKILVVGVFPVVLLIMAWLLRKYVKSWVHSSQERLARFKEIAGIVRRICQELVNLFPNATWDDLLKMAVERAIKEMNIEPDKAQRECIGCLMDMGFVSPKFAERLKDNVKAHQPKVTIPR